MTSHGNILNIPSPVQHHRAVKALPVSPDTWMMCTSCESDEDKYFSTRVHGYLLYQKIIRTLQRSFFSQRLSSKFPDNCDRDTILASTNLRFLIHGVMKSCLDVWSLDNKSSRQLLTCGDSLLKRPEKKQLPLESGKELLDLQNNDR